MVVIAGRVAPIAAVVFLLAGCAPPEDEEPFPGGAIFVHVDGAGVSAWNALRMLDAGPDGEIAWDRLPHAAVYRGHVTDSLTATSNGGATVHAFGVKVRASSFGNDAGEPIESASGFAGSLVAEAEERGLRTGLVNSGTITEPGTACYAADVELRWHHAEIARQLVESGVDVILGGGERYFLPRGVEGRHGAGAREDGVNLIDRARELGYAVVFDREQLAALPAAATKVLGLFATRHTFHARPEEQLAESGQPLYEPDAPTVAEMLDAALARLADGERGFVLVVEEEGSDNFGNANNAAGMLEALRRADAALGRALAHVERHPSTLVVTAADSEAGGLEVVAARGEVDPEAPLDVTTPNGAPLDGRAGAGTPPFLAAPDARGRRLPFGVSWSTPGDVSGAILCRAAGNGAERVRGSIDNTEIFTLMREAALGR